MTNQFEKYNIPKEKLKFSNKSVLHDLKLDTKPASYMRDAWNRFKRNKGSVVAFGVICFLVLFAIVVPFFTQYTVSFNDTNFGASMPRNKLFVALGIDAWDGCREEVHGREQYLIYLSMGVETGHNAIKNQQSKKNLQVNADGSISELYTIRLDTYHDVGTILKSVDREEYQQIQQYQDEMGVQVIYPITQHDLRPQANQDNKKGYYWFKTEPAPGGKTRAVLDEYGNFINIYIPYTGGFDNYTSKMRIEGEGSYLYDYAEINQTGYQVRLNYYEYFIFQHTYVLKDGITEPHFLLGTTEDGKDILTCLASGARFSFLLAIIVASVNLTVGTIYGAIEGYYGGTTDLIMERIADILASIPFMIVIVLLTLHMRGASPILIMFIAFFVRGWIGMAGGVRRQFYRFKNSEYVLAARTLGAKDWRIMFKHIFPNSLGTLITGSVLVIPSMFFTESSLTYLGILNLETSSITSVGTLLAKGQLYLQTYPHIILFPSIFISLTMLSFNLFGNGLRDAFNPSLRGVEE